MEDLPNQDDLKRHERDHFKGSGDQCVCCASRPSKVGNLAIDTGHECSVDKDRYENQQRESLRRPSQCQMPYIFGLGSAQEPL